MHVASAIGTAAIAAAVATFTLTAAAVTATLDAALDAALTAAAAAAVLHRDDWSFVLVLGNLCGCGTRVGVGSFCDALRTPWRPPCPASCGSRDIEVAGRAGSAALAASSEPTAATLSLALQNGPHTRAAAQLRAEAR